jgi:hypothetical protein
MVICRRACVLAAGFALAVAPMPATSVPPSPMEKRVPMGGAVLRTDSRWVAPFVEYTEVRGDRWESHKVRWFSEKGEVLAETDSLAANEFSFDYYFTSGPSSHLMFHGMYNDWQLPAPSAEYYGVASTDGRVFLIFTRNETSSVQPATGPATGATVYARGKLGAKLGPFPGMTLTSAPMGADGSVAALFSTTANPEQGRVLVTDANARITMTLSTTGTEVAYAAPDGRGALLTQMDGTVLYAHANDSFRRVSMGRGLPPHAQAMQWVPGSGQVFIAGTETHELILLDCDKGSAVWRAPSLGTYHVVAFDRYVFETGIASASDDATLRVGAINAIDIKTGNLVATWRSNVPARGIGKLMMRDHRLYYVTDDIFGEIQPEQVAKGESSCCGWQRVPGLHPSLRNK